MDKNITISNITGSNNSPFDIYLCQSDFTDCTYITTINFGNLPYTFQVPPLSASLETFGVIVVDQLNCNLRREITILTP